MATPHYRYSRLRGEISELMGGVYPPSRERIAPLLAAIHRFDQAHIVGLRAADVLHEDKAARLMNTLAELEPDVVTRRIEVGGHIHSGEEYLTSRLGEGVAGKLHTGRSSGDLYAVATRVVLREHYLRLARTLLDLLDTCVQIAETNVETVLPSYTHLQHAQMTSLGHYMSSWVAEGLRTVERVRQAYERNNVSPAGAAVGTGSPFPLDPAVTADLLGFDAHFTNSREAIWATDLVLEGHWIAVTAASTWARLAEDLQVWSTAEFGMVEVGDEFCINSSILPQKKNPIALQHIRSMAGVTSGRLASAATILRAVSDTLVIDREVAIEELWQSLDAVDHSLQLFGGVLRSLRPNTERMRELAESSWAYCSDLASALTEVEGISWRQAQQVVSTMVRHVIDSGRGPAEATMTDLDLASKAYIGQGLTRFGEDDWTGAVDPDACIRARKVAGGPAPDDVRRQLAVLRGAIAAEREAAAGLERRLEAADERLAAAVARLLEGAEAR